MKQTPEQISSTYRDAANDARLMHLWESRSRVVSDFGIGPGDVLAVSVPGVTELEKRTVRVSGDGDISLPLIGSAHVAGLTEDQTRDLLCKRLEKFMYHPQVDIFIQSFSSREVAITGAVHSPGMYTLNGPSDTIRDVLERAGGMTDGAAAEQIVLTPASPHWQEMAASARDGIGPVPAADGRDPAAEATVSSGVPDAAHAHMVSAAFSPKGSSPIVINLTAGKDGQRYLDLPVRPGDTLYVPPAGSVTVVGWVYSPKTMAVTPGLTVLGAVSSAGGLLFAGDATDVKILRQGREGKVRIIRVNLDKIKNLQASDLPLRANDVVEVPYSTLRMPGYAVYYAVQGIVSWVPPMLVMSPP